MSRVVYVGNFEPPHSTENEVRRALQSLGHDVIIRQENEYDSWIKQPECDVFLWTRTKSLSDQVDEELRWAMLSDCFRRGIPTVGYHLDRWWGLRRQTDVENDPFFRVSLLCTADGGHDAEWRREGVTHAWFPPAVSEAECGLASFVPEFECDVVFVGSWQSYGHDEWWPTRSNMLAHVRSWYPQPGRFVCWPQIGQPAVRGPRLASLYASAKVVVGDSCLVPRVDGLPIRRYWSDRIPETLGRGGILVHPYVDGLAEAGYPPRLPATYPIGDMDTLHDEIEMLLRLNDDERLAMRKQAVDTILRSHTYTVRMRQLWKKLGL